MNKFKRLKTIYFNRLEVSIVSKIKEIVKPIVTQKDAFVVDVEIRGNQTGTIVEIFVDDDKGITSELCAEISREVSHLLDATDLFNRRYHLVVSSPGVDRPIKYPRQYPKNIGRELIVKFKNQEKIENIQGILSESTTNSVTLRLNDDSIRTFTFDLIIEARVCTLW